MNRLGDDEGDYNEFVHFKMLQRCRQAALYVQGSMPSSYLFRHNRSPMYNIKQMMRATPRPKLESS